MLSDVSRDRDVLDDGIATTFELRSPGVAHRLHRHVEGVLKLNLDTNAAPSPACFLSRLEPASRVHAPRAFLCLDYSLVGLVALRQGELDLFD